MNPWLVAAAIWLTGGAIWTLVIWRTLRRSERALKMFDDFSMRTDVAKGYRPVRVVKTVAPLEVTEEVAWEFGILPPQQNVNCPACKLICALHREYPHLNLDQLDAVVRRRVALGHCPAHSYADAPD